MSPTSISNSDNRRKAFAFLGRFFVFALPVFAFAGALEFYLNRTGESWPAQTQLQTRIANPNVLIGNRFMENHRSYQWLAAKTIKPDIMVLGSSRVGQIRSEMFHPLESQFYNATMSLYHLGDLKQYRSFWEQNPDSKPKTLILGVDPQWLTHAPDTSPWMHDSPDKPLLSQRVLVWRKMFSHLSPTQFWSTLSRGAGHPAEFTNEAAYGIKAMLQARGIRGDGSYQYNPKLLLEAAQAQQFRSRGNNPSIDQGYLIKWAGPPEFYPQNVDRIARELVAIRNLGIEVLPIFPPLADPLMDAFKSKPKGLDLWRLYSETLIDELNRQGFLTVNALDKAARGMSDLHMVDLIHPGELLSVTIVLEILEKVPEDSILRGVGMTSVKKLRDNPAASPLLVIPLNSGNSK